MPDLASESPILVKKVSAILRKYFDCDSIPPERVKQILSTIANIHAGQVMTLYPIAERIEETIAKKILKVVSEHVK